MKREIILNIHSILGFIVFTTGLLQILLKKEGVRHIITGQVYLVSWFFILLSGAYIGGPMITIIGVFGFYFALTGARIGRLKKKRITLFEKSIFSIGGLVSLAMIYFSLTFYLKGKNSSSIIFGVFGAIFLYTTLNDIFKYILQKPLKKQLYGNFDWYFEHLIRMSISFIAAITAFTSIQNIFKNNTLNFLMPTFIGIIIINIVSKKLKKKLLK